MMRTRLWLAATLIVALTAPAFADRRTEAKEYVEWGITCAQKSLWPQAVIQFEKATEKDPTYAAAWNNLAIAYEHDGKFEEAKKAYEKAIQLDPKNPMIRQNYDLFKEINDRTKRRAAK